MQTLLHYCYISLFSTLTINKITTLSTTLTLKHLFGTLKTIIECFILENEFMRGGVAEMYPHAKKTFTLAKKDLDLCKKIQLCPSHLECKHRLPSYRKCFSPSWKENL